MSHRRSRSRSPPSYTTNSNDPRDLERRIFVGNLPTANMAKKDMEDLFRPYGKIQASSLFRGYGFVQFERVEDAEAAKAGHSGRIYRGYKLDINMAAERRQPKPRSSPPRRSASSYGDSREARPRSRSPATARDLRYHREGREIRSGSRESRPAPTRDERALGEDRYRGSESREKDPALREGSYDRFYRGEYDYYRKKEEAFPDRYQDPWNGRREPEERVSPEERRRNELYAQYYEVLQRRYDADRPVDCSVIVVNKLQKEYAETVGRKVRDQGMVVDLIFLNTEVSLTQALEDVSRARTPFAIIITQQHQVHRSCTVNMLKKSDGNLSKHRNMPIQDAMLLVAHNFESYKVEHRAKEREELSRKAAKMADEVLMREHEREGHPVSVLTAITLLSEGRFMTPEELGRLINYLTDKRDHLVRGSTEAGAISSSVTLEPPQTPQPLSNTAQPLFPGLSLQGSHLTAQSSHLTSQTPTLTQTNQELQAKILSMFTSGSSSTPASVASVPIPQTQNYASTLAPQVPKMSGVQPQSTMVARPTIRPQGVRMQGVMGVGKPGVSGSSGINFDNPSVQKALDTLIQSGPINQLVNMGAGGQGLRPGQGSMDQTQHYSRHY
ncbi:hypothetical protein DNTS_014690 [Danionella cerebrum]|uniref:RRM domain-containing protein n=1 Tax=Danionella cerebrum TaxID=2873325 RepID=A0A553R9M1_9TELE|nr:hypothetical protein DNTS_014690 [Danionella translucida]